MGEVVRLALETAPDIKAFLPKPGDVREL